MQFLCKKEELAHAVQIVQKAVSNKPQMPILSGIYLNATADNTLELQATDYELGIKCIIDAEIKETGAIVLSGRYFQEVVRRLPGESVEIRTNQEDRMVKIVSHMAQFNLLSLPAAEFPVLQPLEDTTNFVIRDNILKDLIKKTSFACSTDESRPVFTGSLLELSESNIVMVATNTHRLAIKREFVDQSSMPMKIIIPARILNELARIMIAEVPSDVSIRCNRTQISFALDNVYITSRLIEGQFPDYNRVIPTEFATNITLSTDEFSAAVERVSLISRSGDYNVIKLAFKEKSVLISSNNPDIGKAEESVDISLQGNPLEIAFNAKYVTDILKNIDSETFYFSLNTPLSPASIRPCDDAQYNYIITPVRTN